MYARPSGGVQIRAPLVKPADRTRLTSALREHVAKIAADLRTQVRAPGAPRDRARQLHADEQVGEDFDVWTDLLSRRAAVLWVLKSVYVRVLEDRGLLAPGRILDSEAQELFERLAPNLGETAFLRWVYRDLQSPRGGLPELFSPQPAEVALPSDDLSRALLAFWRHRDADSGAHWSFTGEHFDGELMGDLYQELDPVVKDRFALCQTPDFVRAFILDRTLTPAIEAFGADQVRLLDPACGSGHFLIDGLKRLVAATAEKHPDWSRVKVVTHALDRVVGIDLNDYACALARARLVMTAGELAGATTLAEAAQFHPHVYWADGLEQVERVESQKAVQMGLFEPAEERPRATLTRPEVRIALRKVLEAKFHAVVANPPYIVESDDVRKNYHREKVGRGQRYVSAYRQYSLASPFTERCFQLAEKEGYIGIITSNNFMKREFGKPLIEKVLAELDLTLVVDTSQAYIPYHGTPTVLLFGRNRRPVGDAVRAVMGKRGETGTPAEPAKGRVWSSIVEGWATIRFENEFVSVADMPRGTLARHPWSLGGGGAAELTTRLEANATTRLGLNSVDIGQTTVCGEDDVYMMLPDAAKRHGATDLIVPLMIGEVIRDWSIKPSKFVLYPYRSMGGIPVAHNHPAVSGYFWRFRTLLKARTVFGKSPEDRGDTWYEHLEHYDYRLRTPISIAFAFVATHNHFVLDRGGKVFNRSAPVIKLPAGATEDEHLALLGLLNSSTLGFWMRQVFHIKGGESTGKKRQSETWSRRLEYDATKLQRAPVVDKHRDRITRIATRLDRLATEGTGCLPAVLLSREWRAVALSQIVDVTRSRLTAIRAEMIGWQEELDWTVYSAFGLVDDCHLAPLDQIEPLASEHRPFAIRLARSIVAGEATRYWFDAMGAQPTIEIPAFYHPATRARMASRLALIESQGELALLESPECKRKWETSSFDEELLDAAFRWMASRIEQVLQHRSKPVPASYLVGAVQDDERLLALASIYQGRNDVDLSVLVGEILASETVPNQAAHTYTESGLTKRAAWEEVWALQRREDAGENVGDIPVPPEYSQGSRGKSTDFLRNEYWQLRGKLDVPKERFIAFTEVPGRSGVETLYGWAGWTPLQRLRAILAIDEELEDAGVSLADRTGLLDSAWRLLPDVSREDAAAAVRLKAELQALVGPTGPSREQVEDWRRRFPPPHTRAGKARRTATRAQEAENEEGTES
jgi:hypothetical protein